MVEQTGMRVSMIVTGFMLLMAAMTGFDAVSQYLRNHQVRYFSLGLCVVFLVLAAVQAKIRRP
jgi:hypothetical protein